MNKKPVALAFGSNLGDRRKSIDEAFKLLSDGAFEIEKISTYVESAPVDCTPDSGIFINGVLTGFWSGSAEELLLLCQGVEMQLGRKKVREINSPRPIDLGILLFDREVINKEHLVIPHQRMHLRDFVMLPLDEIAPDWEVTGMNKKVYEIAGEFK